MNASLTGIHEATALLEQIAQRMVLRQGRGAAPTPKDGDIGKAMEGLEQFLAIAGSVDDDRVKAAAITRDDVTRLGDYGLNLLMDMERWAREVQARDMQTDVRRIVLTVVEWVLRHDGQIETLDPIVDACAAVSNDTQDQTELGELACLMTAIASACATSVRADLEKSNPGRPWRLLHWNLAISATRSNRLELMDKSFAQLLLALPEEASVFFREGMREMERLNYSSEVRAVMQRYFDRYTRPGMN